MTLNEDSSTFVVYTASDNQEDWSRLESIYRNQGLKTTIHFFNSNSALLAAILQKHSPRPNMVIFGDLLTRFHK